MKWFKHDSNASTDAKLEKLMIKYGLEGYGLYWFALEMIASQVEKHNLTFELEHDADIIANRCNMYAEKVQDMMQYMVQLQLFENNMGIITCPKMATRTDEYTQNIMRKLNKTPDKITTHSQRPPDELPLNRIEENRIDLLEDGVASDRFNDFWDAYPRKVNKRKAKQIWDRKKLDIIYEKIIDDVRSKSKSDLWTRDRGKYIQYPSTYLNNERWNDEENIFTASKYPEMDWMDVAK